MILADMHMDMVCLETGLLHDMVEDTSVSLDEIRKEFGDEVARCVDGVTKLSKLNLYSREERQAESVRKMLLAMVNDIRVIIVKLADRLHNMRTLGVAAARAAGAHRAGDARNLRAHRAPPGNGQSPRRAGGPGVPVPGAGSLGRRCCARSNRSAQQNEEFLQRDAARPWKSNLRARRHSGARGRPRQAGLLGVPEAEAAEDRARSGVRSAGAAHHHRFGEELLRRAGRDPQRMASHSRAASRTSSPFRGPTSTSRCTPP